VTPDKLLQPPDRHLTLQSFFKLRHRHVELHRHEIRIAVLADELPAGKQIFTERALLQLRPQILIGNFQTETICLVSQHLFLHQRISRALHHIRHQHVRQLLLLQHPASQPLHLLRGNLLIYGEDAAKISTVFHDRIGAGCVARAV